MFPKEGEVVVNNMHDTDSNRDVYAYDIIGS